MGSIRVNNPLYLKYLSAQRQAKESENLLCLRSVFASCVLRSVS